MTRANGPIPPYDSDNEAQASIALSTLSELRLDNTRPSSSARLSTAAPMGSPFKTNDEVERFKLRLQQADETDSTTVPSFIR
ncbi:hypothetical protein F2P81_000343 [Scophthalmus maximus]|uniref:Uncharacterized protein n=1 Tax=Scophthalmus maximus TaxID=52904 RepID=A0A6A4TSY4_SCOMX|nr:hypothetical protein F2P81_000343 [Scophthalmus maximus]